MAHKIGARHFLKPRTTITSSSEPAELAVSWAEAAEFNEAATAIRLAESEKKVLFKILSEDMVYPSTLRVMVNTMIVTLI